MSEGDKGSKTPKQNWTPKKPWPLRVPQLGKTYEEFLELAAERTGRPQKEWDYDWEEAHYYQFQAIVADGEIGKFIDYCGMTLVGLVVGEEERPEGGGREDVPKIRRHEHYWPARLMISWMWHHHIDNEFWRVMNTRRPLPDGKEALLAFPDNPAWTAEESLALKFGAAALERRMTDELWNAAVAMWGQSRSIRYVTFLGYYCMLNMLIEALGVTKYIGALTPLDYSQNPPT